MSDRSPLRAFVRLLCFVGFRAFRTRPDTVCPCSRASSCVKNLSPSPDVEVSLRWGGGGHLPSRQTWSNWENSPASPLAFPPPLVFFPLSGYWTVDVTVSTTLLDL